MKYMNKDNFVKKGLVLGIIVLFVGASVGPSINANIGKISDILDIEILETVDPPDEEWNKTFGGSSGDVGVSVNQTTDGGYILTGYTYSYGNGLDDVWLIKTDSSGNMQWNKTFGGYDFDWGWSVQQTSNGGYIIIGGTHSYGAGDSDVWLIKTDGTGDIEWNKTYGGSQYDGGHSVQQTNDGGFIITGVADRFYSSSGNVWLIKTDSDGSKVWDKKFGGPNFDRGECVQQTEEGGYIIVGSTKSFGAGSYDIWLIKTDADGNKTWDNTFGGSKGDKGRTVYQTSDGGYIITGWTESYGAGSRDIWLIKTDADGNKTWDRTFGGSNQEMVYASSLQQPIDDGYIIIGSTASYGDGSSDVWLIKTDNNGNNQWNKTFGGTEADSGWSVQQTISGGYIIIGCTNSYGAGDSDYWLIKVEPENGENRLPFADANGPYSGCVEEEMLFDASGSYDPDPGGSIAGYRWDWENDGVWDTEWLPDPQIRYAHYEEIHGELKLEVKDNMGATDNDTAFIQIAEPFYFVHITDTHISTRKSKSNFEKIIKHIDSFVPKSVFLIISGDLVELGARKLISIIWYQQFNRILDDHGITRYCCPGNHDYYYTWVKSTNLKNYYKYIDSRDDYTFRYSNTQIFSLNSGKDIKPLVIDGTGLTDEQIRWLNETLDQLDGVIDYKDNSGLNKIIFMHHPVINYGGKIWKRWNVSVISQNRKEFTDLCDTYGVDLVLTGHTHENKIYKRSDDGNNVNGQSAPIICTEALYVQTEDCKNHCTFRKITIRGDEITVGESTAYR